MNFYNEIDAYAARWLDNLIDAGEIPPGDVCVRSIEEVTPDDLEGYKQHHFFAGIAGWSLALRLAGWPADRPVWTGSCPCQPFSCAGKKRGASDDRHLWPAFFELVAERRPSIIFGEQVASKLGREWLTAVRLDLESLGYVVGAACLPACSVGAPHRRERLFWGAARDNSASKRAVLEKTAVEEKQYRISRSTSSGNNDPGRDDSIAGHPGSLGNPLGDGRDFRRGADNVRKIRGKETPWDRMSFFPCHDGKWRPVKPGILPLAHGVSARVGKLRGYGNAIVPQVAAAFILAFLEAETDIISS